MDVVYRFRLPDGKDATFEVALDPEAPEAVAARGLPDWTRLEHHQCGHCPLDPAVVPRCPLAARIADVVERFESVLSYEHVQVEVRTEARTVTGDVTAQQGLSALMGLIMATSDCPHTRFFRPMARHHLPLANQADTVYRAASMYMLAQYFRGRSGKPIDQDLTGLVAIYENIQVLNRAMAARVRDAIRQDAAVNAIVVLDFFAQSLPFAIEDQLDELLPDFEAYMGELPTPPDGISGMTEPAGAVRSGGRMPIEELTPPEAREAMDGTEGAVYLDVRTVEEFAAGHPQGALNVPIATRGRDGQMQFNPDFLRVVQNVVPKETPVFCGCQMGGRSMRAAEMMQTAGYGRLVNVRGGFGGLQDPATGEVVAGWMDEGLPTERGDGGERSYASLRKQAGLG